VGKKHLNATHYEEIPPLPRASSKAERIVHAVIETPKHSPHKYALNNDFGIIAFHEQLPGSMRWPFDYGFVPGTLADDGDPLDVLVLTDAGLFSGCFIVVRVLGTVRERKNGIENDRLIAVPLPSPGAPKQTDRYRDIGDLPQPVLEEIVGFLRSYSERQGNAIEVRGVAGAADAMKSVKRTTKAFAKANR
jgi:inorganic pyrophosphatase